jgi:signal transduction histidine kinase/ActR/RegA family two-component response regulator
MLADRLGESLLLLRPTGDVAACNSAARRLLKSDCVGVNMIAHAVDGPRFRRYLMLASRSASPLPGMLRLHDVEAGLRCDASAVILEGGEHWLVMHLRSASEAAHSFIALNQQIERLHAEIEHRKRLERERETLLASEQQARAEAEDASRFKDELLAAISHELRTPLHAISGWVALIRDDLDDRQRLERGLEVIERNVSAELKLTEDLVDTASAITGRIRLEVKPVDLAPLLRDAVESIRPSVQAKSQRLEVRADVEACVANGDPDRLLQVVWNLLSNASKYTPEGGEIQVLLRRIESHAEIVVSDTGHGIGRDLLPYVFDRFRRLDTSSTRRFGGLGLGLAIVRHLVELHGGVVMADSPGIDQGATFTVNLPLQTFQRHSKPATEMIGRESNAEEGLLAGLQILLVEDHTDSREILSSILMSRGADLTAVGSAAQAQVALRQDAPHLIISDVEMPDEDGFTLMRKLRDLERELGRTSAPAIAISAHSIGSARVHALRAGYQAFVSKPMKPAELVALIASLCERAQ